MIILILRVYTDIHTRGIKTGNIADGLYFTEQQYKAYVFREGWDNCTEDDLAKVKKIIDGYAIEEVELDECLMMIMRNMKNENIQY